MPNGKETLFWYPETDKFYGFPSDSADFYKEKYPSFQEVSIFRDPKGNEQWLPESKLKDAASILPGYDLVVPEVIKPPEEPPPEEKPKKPARRFFEGEISEDEYMQEMIAAGKDVNKEAILETAGFMGSKETGEDEPNFAVPFASLPSIVSDSDLPKEEQFSFNAAKYDLPDTYTITDQNLAVESSEIYKWLEQSPHTIKPIIDDYEKTIETINAGGREIEEIKDKIENINKQLEAFSYEEIGEGEEKKKVYTAKDEHEYGLLTDKLNKYNMLVDESNAIFEQYEKTRKRLIEIDKIYQKQQMDHEVNYSRYMEIQEEMGSRGFELKQREIGEQLKSWLQMNEATQKDQEGQSWALWDNQTNKFVESGIVFRDITVERIDPEFNISTPVVIQYLL
jgi:predicted  nucleic acid-binding Zn-ribbon protein